MNKLHTPPPPTADVLDKAADFMEGVPFTKGGSGWRWKNPESGVCLEGGILAALGVTPEEIAMDTEDDDWHGAFKVCPAYQAVREYLGRAVSPRYLNPYAYLYDYNDNEAQGKEDVIQVLRNAATYARENGIA